MARRKTIEENYRSKNSLRNTILNDPNSYIGSTEKQTETRWIYDEEAGAMVQRQVSYVPGLLKIFDELLINAADHRRRYPTMTCVKIEFNAEQNLITVSNDGRGIPVVEHKEEGIYVPELLFGQLSTSGNYGKNVIKTIVGRRGYGAKLTNIFSTEFTINISDGNTMKNYQQTFSKNMGKTSEPIITKMKNKRYWTTVSFKPDLKRFDNAEFDHDIIAVMKSRVYSFAGCLGEAVIVSFNGEQLEVKSFKDYVNMYPTETRVIEKFDKGWEICVTLSEGPFEQVSFANSVATINGGTHVDYVVSEVTKYIENIMKEKHKDKSVDVKNHLRVFVNALIADPEFDTPRKEKFTQTKLKTKCKLSEALETVANSGVIERLLSWETSTQSKEGGEKVDGDKTKSVHIEKLHDASTESLEKHDCTLIITEGDSAKYLVMAGLAALDESEKEKYGVYPLQGKLYNVRKAKKHTINKNRELQNIRSIIGLKDESCTTTHSLRYKHVMILTDQDEDGAHIKGLLINFFHHHWPELLKVKPPFLSEFRTPIVKVTSLKEDGAKSLYSMVEYKKWKNQHADKLSEWETRYYKGLGTHTREEGREYFTHIADHKRDFVWDENDNGEAIDCAFNKNSEDRKQLINNFDSKSHHHETEAGQITFTDFIKKDLVPFFIADMQRSIPSMIDGFKPVERKIFHCLLNRTSNKEIKVSQVSALVLEQSVYYHSDQCLNSTTIKMAHDHVGSNNMPLLQSLGQFGTRNKGGKDCAKARYLRTKLSPETRVLFPKEDDEYAFSDSLQDEHGKNIEPRRCYPIIPTILVNGCEGIGSGWSTFIPKYKITDVISNLERLLDGGQTMPMDPWYQGFNGTIVKHESGDRYTTAGQLEVVDDKTRLVTELPIKVWTHNYKALLDKAKEKSGLIENYLDKSDGTTVRFQIKLKKANIPTTDEELFAEKRQLKLTSSFGTSNMHLFNQDDQIKRYESPQQIIEEFYDSRLKVYIARKERKLEELKDAFGRLNLKIALVSDVFLGKFRLDQERCLAELDAELREKYRGLRDYYNFLLDVPTSSYSKEKLKELEEARDKVEKNIEEVENLDPEEVWRSELQKLREAIEKRKSL